MKFLVLAALISYCSAGYLAPAAHVLSTGSSAQHRSQDGIGNYAFGYQENHATGGTTREERGDAYGNKVGSYSLAVADGRIRKVHYVADAAGFRANIVTNEPGTAPQDPAAVTINGPDAIAVAAPIAAPIAAATIAAPAYGYAGHGYAGYGHAPIAAAYGAPLAHGYGYGAPLAHGYGLNAPLAHGYAYGAPAYGYGHGY